MEKERRYFAARWCEASWLAALVAVPLFFNPYVERVFEGEKALIVRALALFMLPALLTSEAARHAWRSVWRSPVVKAAGAFGIALVLATTMSILPQSSIWGSYARLQGLCTSASYLVVFAALAALLRRRDQLEAILSAVLIAGLAMSSYAILQNAGYAPSPWVERFDGRAHATEGNPIFLGAILAMMLPLAVVRGLEAYRAWRALGGGSRTVSLFLHSILLVMIGTALVLSRSRGPLLGGLVSVVVFVTLLSSRQGRTRLLGATLGLALLAGSGLALVSWIEREAAPSDGVGRLVRLVDAGSAQVRILLWQAAADLLAANPGRALVGYGPETAALVLPGHLPPLYTHFHGDDLPDRAHNQSFDTVITIGAFGLVAQLAVVISLAAVVLRQLALLRTRQQGWFALIGSLGALVAGVLAPRAATGSWAWSGAGLTSGLLLALVAYASWAALRQRRGPARPLRSGHLIAAGLLSAIAGHFVETSFAISTTTTSLYFWAYAGILAAFGVKPLRGFRGRETQGGRGEADDPVRLGGLLSALAVMLLVFAFYSPGLAFGSLPVLIGGIILPVSAWSAFGAVLRRPSGRARLREFGRYAAVMLPPVLAFAALIAWWVHFPPSGDGTQLGTVLAFSHHRANLMAVPHAGLLAIIALLASSMPRRASAAAPQVCVRLLPIVSAAAALWAFAELSLNPSRADVLSRLGNEYGRHRLWDYAVALQERAVALQPNVERYEMRLAHDLLEKVQALPRGPAGGDSTSDLVRAERALRRVHAANPLNVAHAANLARLHQSWGDRADDPAVRAQQHSRADEFYGKAAALAPSSALVVNEWARALMARGDLARALLLVERSLGIDAELADSYRLRAEIYEATGDTAAALSDRRRAGEIEGLRSENY